MASTARIGITANHDICQRFSPLVRAGTPGEITDVGGASSVSYTVKFWPSDGGSIILHDVSRMDLRET